MLKMLDGVVNETLTPPAMTAYANKLTPGQRSVIRNLDERWATIGCGEDVAKALCVANSRRPALVKRRHSPHGDHLWQFALTKEGADLKRAVPNL